MEEQSYISTHETIEELREKELFNFRKYAWRQLKKNKPAYWSFRVLVGLVIIAILAPLLANEKPLYMKYRGEHFFPALSFKNKYQVTDERGNTEIINLDVAKWKRMDLETVIWAPIVYSPHKSDRDNGYLNAEYMGPGGNQLYKTKDEEVIEMPRRYWHWLGTMKKGEDVLSGLIHGTKISLLIGLVSMGIASIIGLLLGALAGYYGDHGLRTRRGTFWSLLVGVVLAFYYGFMMRGFSLADGLAVSGFSFLWQLCISIFIFIVVCLVFYLIGMQLSKMRWLNESVDVPVDSIVLRTLEILLSIPGLILIISIAAMVREPSIINIMLIIGFTRWAGIARFTRAEFLRIRSLDYMQAAKALGYSSRRIIFKHALPNSLAPALVAIAFGVASAILIESSLSFLGIGVPHDVATWGSLLNAGRENFNAWWLVVFPGLAIFVTVTVYNLIGEGLRDALDPKLRY